MDYVLGLLKKYLPGPFKPSGGDNILTTCPFHKGGNENKPSFSVNTASGLFHCFTGGCEVSGGIDKLLKLLNLPPHLVDAELRIIKPHLDASKRLYKLSKDNFYKNADVLSTPFILPESVTGIYDFCPESLVTSGFDIGLLKDMGVGYDQRHHRVMYPVRDMHGNLAGFSGGKTVRTQTHLDEKYRVYQGSIRKYDGTLAPGDFGEWFDAWFKEWFSAPVSEYKCENHNYLWNFHNVWARRCTSPGSVDTIYLVEGFKACLWMVQTGFINTVAVMGSYLSDVQGSLLHKTGAHIVLCLDNDEAGIKATIKMADRLMSPMHGNITVIQYPAEDFGHHNTQPDDYEPDSLRWMVNNRRGLVDHMRSVLCL